MQRQARTVQAFGFGLVAVVIFVGTMRALRHSRTGRSPSSSPFTFRLINREAAYPGKVIRAQLNGTPLPPYKCTDQDAAIAVCAMSNVSSGTNLEPIVIHALDENNHGYLTTVTPDGPAWIISVQAGFSKLPSSIKVTVGSSLTVRSFASVTPRTSASFEFTNIGAPKRVLGPLNPAQRAAAAKVGEVTFNEETGVLTVQAVESPSMKGQIAPTILSTSYAAKSPLWTGYPIDGINFTYFGRGVDTVRVRFDHYKNTDKDTTLTYKNAEIVNVGNKGMMVLPRQDVGAAFGLKAAMGNQPDIVNRKRAGSPHPSRDITVLLSPASNMPGAAAASTPARSNLSFLDIAPSLESMGIQFLNLSVLTRDRSVMGFYKTVLNSSRSVTATPTTIPILSIRLRQTSSHLDSSVTALLPVKHVSRENPNPVAVRLALPSQ